MGLAPDGKGGWGRQLGLTEDGAGHVGDLRWRPIVGFRLAFVATLMTLSAELVKEQ